MSLDTAAMVERRDLPVMPVKIRGGAQPLIPVSEPKTPRVTPLSQSMLGGTSVGNLLAKRQAIGILAGGLRTLVSRKLFSSA